MKNTEFALIEAIKNQENPAKLMELWEKLCQIERGTGYIVCMVSWLTRKAVESKFYCPISLVMALDPAYDSSYAPFDTRGGEEFYQRLLSRLYWIFKSANLTDLPGFSEYLRNKNGQTNVERVKKMIEAADVIRDKDGKQVDCYLGKKNFECSNCLVLMAFGIPLPCLNSLQ